MVKYWIYSPVPFFKTVSAALRPIRKLLQWKQCCCNSLSALLWPDSECHYKEVCLHRLLAIKNEGLFGNQNFDPEAKFKLWSFCPICRWRFWVQEKVVDGSYSLVWRPQFWSMGRQYNEKCVQCWRWSRVRYYEMCPVAHEAKKSQFPGTKSPGSSTLIGPKRACTRDVVWLSLASGYHE